jgi:hypothetical protein
MEFFGNLLPFIIFIIVAISKAKGKEAQRDRKKEMPVGHTPAQKTVTPRSRMDEIRKMGEQFGNTLRKEFQNSLDDMMTTSKNKEPIPVLDEEKAIDQHNEKTRMEFTEKLETPGVETKNEIKDIIKKQEIGGRSITFHRQSIRDGVIMAEVLGKPKALKR